MRRQSAGLLLLLAAVTGGAAAHAQVPATRGAAKGEGKSDAKSDPNGPVTVDADRMERFGKENIVVFTGHVVARHPRAIQYAERTEVYLDERGERILRTVSTGNVRIVTRDCKTGTARRVEYFDLEQRLVLTGTARVWQGDNVVTGETITIYLAEDRNVVEGAGQDRVRAIFQPQEEGRAPGGSSAKRPPTPQAPCTE